MISWLWCLEQYIPEMDERHGSYEEGRKVVDAHEAGYVPDDI